MLEEVSQNNIATYRRQATYKNSICREVFEAHRLCGKLRRVTSTKSLFNLIPFVRAVDQSKLTFVSFVRSPNRVSNSVLVRLSPRI